MTNATTLERIDALAGLQWPLDRWSCSQHRPGQITHPDQLDAAASAPFSATSPGTVASALSAAGQWDFDRPVDIDASDWSFRTSFAAPDRPEGRPCYLDCDGLAGQAEVWLNGQCLLAADNMFRAYRADISSLLRSENDLVLLFRSLKEELKQRRPRPRWKTNLVNHQQLRWHRTSLLGRIPGWSPCAPIVGPWRGVRIDASPVQFDAVQWRASLEGNVGVVNFHARLATVEHLLSAKLRVGEVEQPLAVQTDAEGLFVAGSLRIEQPTLWWPHTHGEPALYDGMLVLETAAGEYEALRHRLGFRNFTVEQNDGFSVRVNGTPVFCRGACWTVSDLLSPTASPEALERDLRLARDAGVNLLRMGGTMTYESDAFYRLCDELGILVWQDFMFANMDYPVEDPAFRANITAEATEQLNRLAGHPCLAIYCGNSEIEQQAAMLGMPREIWSNRWFAVDLPALCRQRHPDAVYIPATPTGGALPFHTRTGVTHYYGVGAYLRSPDELRKAEVKFTSECLAFANVPEPATCFEIVGGGLPVVHHPRWKARVPRDTGAGWDFEDVRDHYLGQLYGVDPVRLRSFDLSRYLQLSRTASGEMMAQAFAEWRSRHSHNSGALVWFYKDLWPAAGWGMVDSHGRPKAAYYYLKRSWRSRQLVMTDEGLDGLDLHLINETASAVAGSVEVALLREPNTTVARREMAIRVEPRSTQLMQADEILGAFHDVTYAYRFGPPHHDVVIATWRDAERQVLGEAFHFVERRTNVIAPQAAIETWTEPASGGEYLLTVSADRFLHAVSLSAEGYLPDDNYFHLPPQRARRIRFRPLTEPPRVFRAELEALNLATPILLPPRGNLEQGDSTMLFTESVENQLSPQLTLAVNAPAVSAFATAACQPLYFTSRGEPIFAWLHAPTNAAISDQGVVICPPIGHEQLHAHRGLRHLAETLAARGMAVMRFDWHGTGDSAGSDDSARCAHWLANVRDAAAWMREKLGLHGVSFVGLRLGALLATEALRDEEFESLVLWSPVTSGRAYVREMQMIDGASAGATSAKQAGSRTPNIEAGGFVLGAETAERLAAMNLLKIRPRCRRALIVARDDAPRSAALQEWLGACGISVDERTLPGVKQMLAEPHQTEVPRQAIDAISQWLTAPGPSTATMLDRFDSAAFEPATMQWSVRPPRGDSQRPELTLREFAWRMNSPRRLFGIVTEPALLVGQMPLVVLLNSGSAYRIGASRLNVLLARRLASHGFRCLRLDVGGLGDSPVAAGRLENDSYAASALGDIAAVLGRAPTDFGHDRCVLVGLCSGAYFAFQSAVQFDDPALVESVLINPLTFFWADGMSIDDPAVVEALAEHWRLARRVKFQRVWRFLRGRGNVGYWDVARMAARRLANRLAPASADKLPRGNSCLPPQPPGHPQTEDLSRDIASVERRGRPLALFLADGDPGLTIMNHHARVATRRLRRSGLLSVTRIANADHTFSRRAPREKLLDRLAEHLLVRYAP